eukprot:762469-Pyramimonas_sp.AAC.1
MFVNVLVGGCALATILKPSGTLMRASRMRANPLAQHARTRVKDCKATSPPHPIPRLLSHLRPPTIVAAQPLPDGIETYSHRSAAWQ